MAYLEDPALRLGKPGEALCGSGRVCDWLLYEHVNSCSQKTARDRFMGICWRGDDSGVNCAEHFFKILECSDVEPASKELRTLDLLVDNSDELHLGELGEYANVVPPERARADHGHTETVHLRSSCGG
jgi:hypothetical protein